MKLEVGMYIRTKYCGICDEIAIRKIIKIDKINNNWFYIDKNVCDIYKDYTNKLNTVNVEKASFNIIDILEVGDYVNGSEILDFENRYIEEDDKFVPIGVITENCYLENTDSWIIEKDIKSVITHEQMEQMAYKVGE